MYKFSSALIIIFVLFGCSSSPEITKESSPESAKNKEYAKELFISGSLHEMKGNYTDAIIDYQEALRLDPSPGIHFALAKNFMRIKKLPAALIHAKDAVKGDTDNFEYNYLLASIYQLGNQPDSAAKVYESIISKNPSDERAYYSLAQIYESSKPLKALELYHKLIDLIGPEWNVLVNIANLNERIGNVEGTISTIEELIQIDPDNLRMRKLLVESYLKTEKYDKALNLTEELLIQFPEDINLIEYKANALIQSDRWTEGAEEYVKLSERADMHFESKIKIGAAFFNHAGKDSLSLPRAKKIFNDIDADTTHWQVKLYLAQIALHENEDSTAVDYFKSAGELAPWNPQIFMSLGGLLFDSGRYKEAIEILEPVIERFPDEFALNLILGISYTQSTEYEKSEPYLKKSLLLNPDDFTSLYAYGITLNQLKKEEEALIYLNRALEKEPMNVSLIGTIGLIEENLGNHDKSAELYEYALSIDSENALVLNNYAYSLAERDIELEKALQMVEKALEIDPYNSSYLDTIGWVYFKLGDYEKARDYIYQSLKENEDNAEVTDHLGDVYFKLNNKIKALEYWEKAFELDPEREGLKEKIQKGEL